jgi:hypothetical protein
MWRNLVAAGHRLMFNVLVSSTVKAPRFLVETQFKCPTEPTDGILQYGLQTKLDFYHYLANRPSLFRDFNLFMGHVMESREYWYQWYDIQERLLSGYNKAFGPLLVDVMRRIPVEQPRRAHQQHAALARMHGAPQTPHVVALHGRVPRRDARWQHELGVEDGHEDGAPALRKRRRVGRPDDVAYGAPCAVV